MSGMMAVLGVDGVFVTGDHPDRPGGDGGADAEAVTSRDAAVDFYENFLVPRFVASASGSGPDAEEVVALKTMVEGFLQAVLLLVHLTYAIHGLGCLIYLLRRVFHPGDRYTLDCRYTFVLTHLYLPHSPCTRQPLLFHQRL